MTKVIVHDQLPGTGKSKSMIERINESPSDEKWIVVAPFLTECHRYAGTLKDEVSGDKQTPVRDDKGAVVYTGEGCSKSGRRFHHPQSGYQTKVEHIAQLVSEGKDIVTTHAALKLFTPETIKDVKDAGYRLLIDEELECIKPHNVKAHRRHMLLKSGVVYEDELGLLRWNPDCPIDNDTKDSDETGFSWDMQIKALCDNGSLVLIPDDKGDRELFMWEYPIEFLKAFDQIDILTYLFEGSVFERYLKFYGLNVIVEKGIMLPEDIFNLIQIVDSPKMNRVGERDMVFSATDQKKYTKESAVSKAVRDNLYNFFVNNTYGKSDMNQRLWTCLQSAQPVFKGSGYTKRYIPHNIKAVNDYVETKQLAYIYNANLHPDVYNYLFKRGDDFTPEKNRYALSELIQWMFRSRIRDKNAATEDRQISLYIPSSRMRNILIDWMEGKYT